MSEHSNAQYVEPRVLVVVSQLGVGGTETHLARTVPALRGAGLDVAVFALDASGRVAEVLQRSGVPVFGHQNRRPGWCGVVRVALALRQVVGRYRPQVLHCFLPGAYIVGTLATIGLPLRRVMSRRSLARYHAAYPGVRWLERQLHRHMAVVLANSRAVGKELFTEGVSPARLGLIYNGVPEWVVPPDRSAARQILSIGAGTLVLVCVANLIAYKGHADLLEALANAAGRLPDDWVLLLVGRDDGIGAALRSQAEALGLGPHIRWVGAVDDVADYLAAADIGVLASHEEGFSNAVLEGMAAGLPMLVTDVGGNAEAIVDGHCGRVVPPRAPSELATALIELVSCPELRERFGARAREIATERFNVERCVELYRELYLNLISGEKAVVPSGARYLV